MRWKLPLTWPESDSGLCNHLFSLVTAFKEIQGNCKRQHSHFVLVPSPNRRCSPKPPPGSHLWEINRVPTEGSNLVTALRAWDGRLPQGSERKQSACPLRVSLDPRRSACGQACATRAPLNSDARDPECVTRQQSSGLMGAHGLVIQKTESGEHRALLGVTRLDPRQWCQGQGPSPNS